MKIKLTEKYRPFSHEIGTTVLIPKSAWKATIFPAKIELESLISEGKKAKQTIIPHLRGPFNQFTVMQDLERCWVRVFGEGKDGFFSYRLIAAAHEILLFVERCPKEGIVFTYEGQDKRLLRKEELIIPTTLSAFTKGLSEKIHFGSFKKQDWTLVKRRNSLEEVLPIWFELGKHIPSHPILDVGTSQLLKQCQDQIHKKAKDKIGVSFMNLFQAGFEGILSPHLSDAGHLGYSSQEEVIPDEASPLLLLGEGSRLIRSLLVEQSEGKVQILPCLPKEIHAGRFTDIHLNESLSGDLEWSKKLIRKVILRPKKDQEVTLGFQSNINAFRLRMGRRGRGKILKVGDSIDLRADGLYILDRFQK